MQRRDDQRMQRARAQLSKKFGPLNLKGGILAWSDEVDPSVPKY